MLRWPCVFEVVSRIFTAPPSAPGAGARNCLRRPIYSLVSMRPGRNVEGVRMLPSDDPPTGQEGKHGGVAAELTLDWLVRIIVMMLPNWTRTPGFPRGKLCLALGLWSAVVAGQQPSQSNSLDVEHLNVLNMLRGPHPSDWDQRETICSRR